MIKTHLLYKTFEEHLFSFQDPSQDRNAFICEVVQDYFGRVRRTGLIIPTEWERAIAEELFGQVNEMLLKKIYGCQSIDEYLTQNQDLVQAKVRRKSRSSMIG